jgi:hypothetical protein
MARPIFLDGGKEFLLLRSLYEPKTADFEANWAISADNAKTHFFISRVGTDAQFAAAIGSILEDAGFRFILEQWHFANRNFMEGMHAAHESGARSVRFRRQPISKAITA